MGHHEIDFEFDGKVFTVEGHITWLHVDPYGDGPEATRSVVIDSVCLLREGNAYTAVVGDAYMDFISTHGEEVGALLLDKIEDAWVRLAEHQVEGNWGR